MRNLILTAFFLLPILMGAQDRYVSASATGSGNGTSTGSPWTLSQAYTSATAGMDVYVKAGDYGAFNQTQTNNGTASNPIRFIGYTNTPGDISATNGPTYTLQDWLSNGQTLPDDVMPHIDFNAPNDIPPTNARGLEVGGNFVTFENFMVSRYWAGANITGDNVTLKNCIFFKLGNWDPTHPCWNKDNSCWAGAENTRGDDDAGYGIYTPGRTDGLTVEDCIVIDAGIVGLFPVGSHGVTARRTEVHSYNFGNGSDYLFDFFSTQNSTVEDCYAERHYPIVGTNRHASRVFILQSQSDNNTIKRFRGKNARFQLENARNNYMENVFIENTFGLSNSGGLQIYGQSDDNTFKNMGTCRGGYSVFRNRLKAVGGIGCGSLKMKDSRIQMQGLDYCL